MENTLSKIDLDILEAAYFDEPWHILCAMVADDFPSMKDLVPRVLVLAKEGLLDIRNDPGTTTDPTEKDLERIALNYERYGTHAWPEGSTWSVKTTEKGSAYIKDRFK
jgi:hypothetical protein